MAGHIDGLNAEEFQAGLEQNVENYDSGAVVLDMEALTYISSAGLRAILFAAKRLHVKGRVFSICSLSEAVSSMIKTVGFDKVIDVYKSSSEAISAAAD